MVLLFLQAQGDRSRGPDACLEALEKVRDKYVKMLRNGGMV